MQNEFDLEYDLKSLVPSVTKEKVFELEKCMTAVLEKPIKLPVEMVYQILNFHGGIPKKQCFKEPDGRVRMICRFCNILEREDLKSPKVPSWRGGEDGRLDYSINLFMDADPYCGRLCESGGVLVPIAVIDTAGGLNAREMSEMDLLCLDYRHSGEPFVVTWNFEMSWSTPEMTIKVADSFKEFLGMLHERPDGFFTTNDCEYF